MIKFTTGIIIIITLFLIGCNTSNNNSEVSENTKQTIVDTLAQNIDSLSKEIRKTPKNDFLFYQRGRLQILNEDISKGINDLEIAKRLNPDEVVYYLDLAEIELRRGESGISKNLLETAHEKFPENIEVMTRLSNIYMAVGQYKKARTYLIKASRIEPRNAKLYLLSSMVFQEIGKIDRALDELYLAIKYDPNYYDAHVMLGIITGKQGKDIAIDHYMNAIRIEPENPEAFYNLAMYYQQTSRYKKAISTYKKGLETIDNTLQHFLFNSAYVYENYLNQPDSALSYYQNVIDYFPDDYRVYYRMGKCYEMKGNINKAMASYDMCLKVNPQFEEAFDALSRLSDQRNKNKSNQ